MIVQVEEKSERRPVKDPAEAPGLFSHIYNFKVGSGNLDLSFLIFTEVKLETPICNSQITSSGLFWAAVEKAPVEESEGKFCDC